MMETVVIVLLAYLIGAVPSGYLIGRIFYGVDLKKTGKRKYRSNERVPYTWNESGAGGVFL